MDQHDLFRQLTRGARFVKRKSVREKVDAVKDEEVNIDCTARSDQTDSGEEESSFNFLHDVSSPSKNKPLKMKRNVTLRANAQKKQIEKDMVAKLRKENRITVLGKNIPNPIISFDELQMFSVPERVLNNLATNYTQPTPIQMQAMPVMLLGRSLMACAPTGSGKTIAFLTPIISALGGPKKVGIRAIILAPTRELAHQIYRECARLAEKSALKIHFINKASQVEQNFGQQSNKKFDILISTPNRVRFVLEQDPPLLDLRNVEWFVIDEADRLMEEGQNNFKDQLDVILSACTSASRKLGLFSATYTVPVAKWALKNIKNLVRINIGQHNSATDTVDQELLFVGSESGKLLAMRELVRVGLKPPVLVFVQSKDRAKELFEELLYDGINVDVIHADRTQQQRDNCVRAFREGNIWVLICTELMGRGIDFKGVNLIINYDFPPSTIAYIHRIGRAGRAGRRGKAITFFTENDSPALRSIATIIKNSGGKIPSFMLQMKKPRKSELKKLTNSAPSRDRISTSIKSEAERQLKLAGVVEKQKRGSGDHNDNGAIDKRRSQSISLKRLAKSRGHGGKKNTITDSEQ